MPDISSLLSQQSPGGAPQGAEPDDGRSSAGSLQALMAARGGQGQAGGQPPAPTYQQTVSGLEHLAEFQKQFRQILKTPNIGKIDIKSEVIDMFADVLADGYVTLPQVMEQMKSLPTNPLQQRQWVEQHYANTVQAMQALMIHYAASPQPVDLNEVHATAAQTKGGKNPNRADLIDGLMGHYRGQRRTN